MSIFRNRFFLVYAFCLLGASQMAAQVDSSIGVMVKIWGKANSLHQKYQLEDSLFIISGPAMETYPGAADGNFSVAGEAQTPWTFYSTDVATVRFMPNKTYLLTTEEYFAYPYQELHVCVPAGYTAEIDGVQRPMMTLNHGAHTYTVRVLASQPGSRRAGEASSLAGAGVQWQVGLGSLQNGTSAGSLNLVDSGTGANWAGLFTPAGLDYLPPSSEIQVFRDGNGNIQQVLANQAVVNVVTNSATQYDIFFYHPGQLVGAAFPYTFNGKAYVQYRVEQGGTATTLQITSFTRNLTGYADTDATAPVVRTAVTTIGRSGSAPNFTWTLHDWNTSGSGQATEQVISSAGAVTSYPPADTRTESLQVQVPGGSVASQASRTFNYYSWGEEPATQTLGSGTGLTTNIVHYDDDSNPGSQGYLQSVVTPGGGWEAYDYWYADSGTTFSGTVKHRYRPFKNAPATVSLVPTQGEVTYYEYVYDAFGLPTRPSLIQTSINNIVTAKTTTTYTSAAHPSSSTLIVVTATSCQYSDASNCLTTVSKYFQEDAGVSTPSEVFYCLQPYSVTNPDLSKVSYSYEHGTFNETTHAFTPSSTGTACRTAVISGSANSAAGSLCTTYGSFTIDGLYLVDGKSTASVTIRDSRALVRRTESYAWSGGNWNLVGYVDFSYDYAGNLTGSVASNGATTSAAYNGDQKTSETDASGVSISYFYDSAGRVLTATKSSGPTTTFGYDAAGRVLTETVSATGTSETIVSGRTYDTAGRLQSETPAGLSAVNYTYDVSGRSCTATFADSSARTEYSFLDGQLDHVDGTAVVPQYYTYLDPATDGSRTTQVFSGSSSSPRWQKVITDRLGRPIHTERPGFSISSQANYVEENFYDLATGHLNKTTRSGLAPTLYQYDALGQMTRSGLDVNNDGSLVLASTDRIADTDTVFENFTGAWWLKTTTTAYPFTNSATAVTTSIKRSRLTGHPTNRIEETRVTDVEGNTAIRTVDINRAAATATITTTSPGFANSQIETVLNGLATSVQGVDGLTSSAQYDGLSRPWRSTDSRNNTITTAYVPGSTLVYSVTDGANNTVSTASYDILGRKQWVRDAANQYTRFAYNSRGQLTNQWGGGTYPVSYGYDSTYGDRTTLNTYRSAPTGDSSTWPSVGTADTTTWTYDAASGLLWKKTDATTTKFTEFDYNVRGQTATRKWARMLTTAGMTTTPVTTTYGYYDTTGELHTKTYNDTAEILPTPSVTFTYTRLGQVSTVTEGTGGAGSHTFNYNTTAPWRLDNETLDSGFYGSRVITRNYDSSSGTGGNYGPYTPGFFKGRYAGYDLGVVGNTARDQHVAYTTSDLGRFVGVNTRVTTGAARDYVYNYYSSSSLIGGYAMGSYFSVTRGYETNRNILTSINSLWNGTSYTRYDYTSNALGQRTTARQSGSAFADYVQGLNYSATYNVYGYNSRGELETTRRYRGDSPTTIPSATDELPGLRFEYRFDSIGNRVTSGSTGTADDDGYAPNALNQYTSRDNKTVKAVGTADVNATVAVAGAPSTGKNDHAWGADIVPANGSGPVQATATVYAAFPGAGAGGADVLRTDSSRTYFIPKRVQQIAYDDDGNMTSDGVWTYTYNAENQLVRMNTLLDASFGSMDVRIDFTYDYQGRRVGKSIWDYRINGSTLNQRFLYDGNNLIAQTDASGNLQRTFTWGLDVAGSLSATGGVGALLQIDDLVAGKTLSPTYDGNGNVAGLVNSNSGALEATYEYDPSGNLLRAEGTYAKSNPFWFSTKWQDDETGLINYGFRYYSPTLGRFINRDPIEEAGGLNLYGFCGNDGINHLDYLGNRNFFSSLWDNSVGAFGKGLKRLEHWTRTHTIGAIALAAFVPVPIFESLAYASEAHYTWQVAKRNPQIAAVVAGIATWYIGGWGAAAVGIEDATEADIVAGAAAGFGGGFVGARASGADLSTSFRCGYQGAAWGAATAWAGSKFLHANPSTEFSWAGARNAFVTAEARYEVGRFSEREFGINGWEFDACQEVFSYIGYHFWGDPYDQHYVNEKNKGIEFNYIGGFGDRNPSTGWFFKAPDFWSRVAHYCGEFAFDANDQLLQWQGLPDAEMIRYAYHGIPIPNIGHSLGASRLVTAASLGLVHGGVAIAMPILEMANGGVQPIIGNGDIVPGFDLGLIGNPEATTVNVRFILGHSLDDYVTQMRIGGQL